MIAKMMRIAQPATFLGLTWRSRRPPAGGRVPSVPPVVVLGSRSWVGTVVVVMGLVPSRGCCASGPLHAASFAADREHQPACHPVSSTMIRKTMKAIAAPEPQPLDLKLVLYDRNAGVIVVPAGAPLPIT